MEDSLKGNWGNRNSEDFLYQIAFDFVAQLEDIMEAEGMDRTMLAAKLGVSKGRVSQILNNPGNLTLKNVVRYARAIDYKVALVAYDDEESNNGGAPINPQVFIACWKRAGKPTDLFAAGAIAATNTITLVEAKYDWKRPILTWKPMGQEAETVGRLHPYVDARYRPSIEDLMYAGTDADHLHS